MRSIATNRLLPFLLFTIGAALLVIATQVNAQDITKPDRIEAPAPRVQGTPHPATSAADTLPEPIPDPINDSRRTYYVICDLERCAPCKVTHKKWKAGGPDRAAIERQANIIFVDVRQVPIVVRSDGATAKIPDRFWEQGNPVAGIRRLVELDAKLATKMPDKPPSLPFPE